MEFGPMPVLAHDLHLRTRPNIAHQPGSPNCVYNDDQDMASWRYMKGSSQNKLTFLGSDASAEIDLNRQGEIVFTPPPPPPQNAPEIDR